MLSDPMTLYKLMNLYMLKQVNFPLANSQLTDFFLLHEYATYFTLQQALNELAESGLINVHSSHNTTRYEITREGEDTLDFFGKNIPPAIVDDMNRYLKENRFRIQTAGSLTPGLEGAPHSACHRRRTKEKGRGCADGTSQEAKKILLLEETQTR